MIKILFVCTGNICRSPTAHAVARSKANFLGLSKEIVFDSAGIEGHHVGEAPDERTIEAGEKQGISFASIFSRQFIEQDFAKHDLIFAMDKYHLNHLLNRSPEKYKSKIKLFLEFCETKNDWDDEVVDPFYGSKKDFEKVFNLIDSATDNLLKKLYPIIKSTTTKKHLL